MKSHAVREKEVSHQFPEQFQFPKRVYQDVEFVQIGFIQQDTHRNCESKVEIEIEDS